MTRDELVKQLSATIGKTKVLELSAILKAQQFTLRDLIDVTFNPNKDIAFRAAWILENLILQKPAAYVISFEYLLSRVKDVRHESCQRHYAKILMHITAKKAGTVVNEGIMEMDMEPIVAQCFDWMIDPSVKIAVKCFAAETLINLAPRYPWIKDELAEQLQFLMRDGTAAIQSRGRRLLAGLKKIK